MTTKPAGMEKSWVSLEQTTLELLDNLGKASAPGCLRRQYHVDADVARAALGATHGEGAEREGRHIV
jgi:hypothetical protein